MTTDTANPYPAVAPATSAAGRASLVVAIIIVAVGVAQQVVSQTIPLMMSDLGLGVATVGVVFGVFAVVLGILAVVGLILGIIGLGRANGSRAAAGAGTAIAASSLLSVLIGVALPFIIDALY